MGRVLGDIKTTDIIARRADLAVAQECLLDNAFVPANTVINRGELLMKSQANGLFRPYAESNTSVSFSNAAKTFTLDASIRASVNFQVGDVIEGVDATVLGTIASYNPLTGVGALVANSTSNYAAPNAVRVAKANFAVNNKQGLILQDEVIMGADDLPVSAFREGFFVKSRTSLTASAISELAAVEETSNEVRIQ